MMMGVRMVLVMRVGSRGELAPTWRALLNRYMDEDEFLLHILILIASIFEIDVHVVTL